MGIQAITRDFGDAVTIVRILTTDDLTTVETTGYLTAQIPNILICNHGLFTYQSTDSVLVSASDGNASYTLSADFSTLIPAGDGSVVSVTSTIGLTIPSGISPSVIVNLNVPNVQNQAYTYHDDSGAANAYVVNLSPAVLTLTKGLIVSFKAANSNTGASTLVINGNAAKAITNSALGALTSGQIGTGMIAVAEYDGTQFQLINPIASGLAPIATLNILSNITGGSAIPVANTLTAIIDAAIGATQGDILYRNATVWTVLAPGTSGYVLATGGAGANPAWASAGAPFTPAALTKADDTNVTLTLTGTPASSLLQAVEITAGWTGTLSSTRGGTGVVDPTAHGVMIAQGASAMTPIVLTAGQILIGTTAGDPAGATIGSGANINVSNSSGAITISATGAASFAWNNVTISTQLLTINNGYMTNDASLQVTYTLPTTAAIGTVFSIAGNSSSGWTIAQNSGQNIQVGSVSSTVGAGGSVSSTNRYDQISLLCVVANTTFVATSLVGNLTIV